jgi:hypothetical protein
MREPLFLITETEVGLGGQKTSVVGYQDIK